MKTKLESVNVALGCSHNTPVRVGSPLWRTPGPAGPSAHASSWSSPPWAPHSTRACVCPLHRCGTPACGSQSSWGCIWHTCLSAACGGTAVFGSTCGCDWKPDQQECCWAAEAGLSCSEAACDSSWWCEVRCLWGERQESADSRDLLGEYDRAFGCPSD